jgi:hypothetical protein
VDRFKALVACVPVVADPNIPFYRNNVVVADRLPAVAGVYTPVFDTSDGEYPAMPCSAKASHRPLWPNPDEPNELELLVTVTVERWNKGAFGSVIDDYSDVPIRAEAVGIREVVDITGIRLRTPPCVDSIARPLAVS